MNSKVTFVELVELMAKASSTTKRVCELFLKELFATVSQALIDGESVKVKGVGTFKVTHVKPRKSVDVNTGEPNQNQGYSKITFTPDKLLAETVNQPFAQFETVILDDAVTDEKLAEIDQQYPSITEMSDDVTSPNEEEPLLDDEAPAAPLPFDLPEMQEAAPAPTPDLLFDGMPDEVAPQVVKETAAAPVAKAEPQEPKEEVVVQEQPAPEPAAKEEPVVEKTPAVKVEPVIEKKPVVEPVIEEKPVVEPVVEEKPVEFTDPVTHKPMLVGIPIDGPSRPVPEEKKVEEPQPERRFYRPEPRNVYTPTPEQIEAASRKPDRRWLWALLGLLAAGLLIWLIARSCSDSKSGDHPEVVVAADTIADGDSLLDVDVQAKPKDEVKPEPKPEPKPGPKPEVKPEPKPEPKPEAPKSAKADEVTDVVTSQIVLTTLSEKHYGSPWFWVYIYEENVKRGIVHDPNNIRPGTRVVIPPADKYGINPHDKASLKKAQIKSMEYLKGK